MTAKSSERRQLRVAIDVGGTFTDLVAIEAATGRTHRRKLLTSPDDPIRAIFEGIHGLLDEVGAGLGEVDRIVHGTTLAGNALIERTGATVGLLTTKGFRDVLEMGNEMRYDLYDLSIRRAPPLVARSRRRGVTERIDADGTVVLPLDEDEVAEEAGRLIGSGADSLAVCLLHSYQNPVHELRSAELLRARFPGVPVTTSFEVAPEIREYERFSTTVANAYILPLIRSYLANLQTRLDEAGFRGTLLIMLSNGGTDSVARAQSVPIHMAESGPTGGILAAVHASRTVEPANILAFDMGGTTAKLSVIEQGAVKRTHETEIARVHRFKKGSGIPLRLPVVDLVEIGAGGGSRAWIDPMGLLKVGPRSSGAAPGPACYGLGGTHPTVTDADLVLGILNGDFFLGGKLRLNTELARSAIDRHVAQPLGIDLLAAARGIFSIVNENMAQAARMYLADLGADPREFTLVASGGAGPVHAFGVARILKIPSVLFPPGAGVASAQGFLVAPSSVDVVRSAPAPLEELRESDVRALFDDMEAEAVQHLSGLGIEPSSMTMHRSVDMRYLGQGFEVNAPVSLERVDTTGLAEAFQSAYTRAYGRSIADVPIEVVSWRLTGMGPTPRWQRAKRDAVEHRQPSLKGTRRVFVDDPDGVTYSIHDRYALQEGDRVAGPAIIEERESTLFIGDGGEARIDESGNVIVTVGAV